MYTQMISKPNACPKCFGSGKLGYRRANGVCFRCNGLGLLPSAESSQIAENIRLNRLHLASLTQTQAPKQAAADNGVADNDGDWLMSLFTTEGTAPATS